MYNEEGDSLRILDEDQSLNTKLVELMCIKEILAIQPSYKISCIFKLL